MAIERVQSANAAAADADSRRGLSDDYHGIFYAAGSGHGHGHRHVGAHGHGHRYGSADGHYHRHGSAHGHPHVGANRAADAGAYSHTGAHGERV